eukprot:gene24212-29281_t
MSGGQFQGSNLAEWLDFFGFSPGFRDYLREIGVQDFGGLYWLFFDDLAHAYRVLLSLDFPTEANRMQLARDNTLSFLPTHGLSENNALDDDISHYDDDISEVTIESWDEGDDDSIMDLYEAEGAAEPAAPIFHQDPFHNITEEGLEKFVMRAVQNLNELMTFPSCNKAAELLPHLTDRPSYRIASRHMNDDGNDICHGFLVHKAIEVTAHGNLPRLCKNLVEGAEWGWGGGAGIGQPQVDDNDGRNNQFCLCEHDDDGDSSVIASASLINFDPQSFFKAFCHWTHSFTGGKILLLSADQSHSSHSRFFWKSGKSLIDCALTLAFSSPTKVRVELVTSKMAIISLGKSYFFLLLACVALATAFDPCDKAFYPLEASLPVIPDSFPNEVDPRRFGVSSNFSAPSRPGNATKLIPRNFWMAFRNKPTSLSDLGEEHQRMIERARDSGWSVFTPGHEEQMQFLEVYYANTSLLWATKLITPSAGASISDIWRVAAVYAFGGFYIDDDSLIGESLETIVRPDDEMIVARERNSFHHTCYHRDYHLAKIDLERRFGGSIDYASIYGGRKFVQWAFFAKPRHPVLRAILENIVEIIRRDYFQLPAVYILHSEPRWKMIICTTGPDVWTTTIWEMYLRKDPLPMRVMVGRDFQEYDAQFKLKEAKHYRNRTGTHYYGMREYYLTSHHPLCIKHLETKPITDGSGNAYLIQDGKRRWIPNYDTLTTLNFTFQDPILIYNTQEFHSIPEGEQIPPLTCDTLENNPIQQSA